MNTAGGPNPTSGSSGQENPTAQVPTARPGAEPTVECPECGEPGSPQRITTWGHCRACRTADSRAKSPLRW